MWDPSRETTRHCWQTIVMIIRTILHFGLIRAYGSNFWCVCWLLVFRVRMSWDRLSYIVVGGLLGAFGGELVYDLLWMERWRAHTRWLGYLGMVEHQEKMVHIALGGAAGIGIAYWTAK